MACFKPGNTFAVGECLLGLFPRCSKLGNALFCIGVLWVAEEVAIVESSRLASACLPPSHF